MKIPVAFATVLLDETTFGEVEAAKNRGRVILEALLESERSFRLRMGGIKTLGPCPVIAQIGKTQMPKVTSCALTISSHDMITHIPIEQLKNQFQGDATTTLCLEFIKPANGKIMRDVIVGTPTAIVIYELLFEAKLVEVTCDGALQPFKLDRIVALVEPIFGTSKILLLASNERRRFYRQAKRQLGETSNGKAVYEMLSKFGVTSRSGLLPDLIGRLFFS